MSIKQIFPESILIFISPPSVNELIKRIKKRHSDNMESINTRMENAISEMNYSGKYDFVLVNDNLDKAYEELRKIILKITG